MPGPSRGSPDRHALAHRERETERETSVKCHPTLLDLLQGVNSFCPQAFDYPEELCQLSVSDHFVCVVLKHKISLQS